MRKSSLLLLPTLLCAVAVLALSRPPPPSLQTLAGVWLGSTEGNGEYLRLELASNGFGVLTVQYLPNDPAQAYLVEATNLAGYSIDLTVRPIDENAEAIFLRGEGHASLLRLELGGENAYWVREVLLERESAVMRRIEAVTERAAKVTSKANKTMEPTR